MTTPPDPTHIAKLSDRLGVKIPEEIWQYFQKYATIVGPILLRELPLVFLHLRSWPQVLADVIAAVTHVQESPVTQKIKSPLPPTESV